MEYTFANRIHFAALFAQLAMRPQMVSFILPIGAIELLTFGAKLRENKSGCTRTTYPG